MEFSTFFLNVLFFQGHSDAAPLFFLLVTRGHPPRLPAPPSGRHIETKAQFTTVRNHRGDGPGVGGRGGGRGGQLGWAVWAVWVLVGCWVFGVSKCRACCAVRNMERAKRRATTTKKGAERWALILVLPRHHGRVVKASACCSARVGRIP